MRLGQRQPGVAEVGAVGVRQRQLGRRAAQVPGQHRRVAGVADGRLGRPRQQLVGVVRQVLVELILAGHEHPQPQAAPPRAAPLLPQRCHPSGKADADGAVQQADVHAQLERAGGDHAQQPALGQPGLDLAALLGGVSGAVGRDPRRQLGRVQQQALAGVAVHQLAGLARLREHDRAQPARDQPHHQRCGLAQRAGADAQLGVQQRRVPDAHVALGGRRPVLVDHGQLAAGQHRTRLSRVGDGGRCQQEPRLRAVGGGDPAAGAPARSPRASRRRRGRRAPRRPPRSAGWRWRPPSSSGRAGCRRAACPGWSGSGSPTVAPAAAPRSACRRRRWPAARRVRAAARGRAPGPAPAPWSDTGRAPGPTDRARSRSAPAG